MYRPYLAVSSQETGCRTNVMRNRESRRGQNFGEHPNLDVKANRFAKLLAINGCAWA